MGFPDSSVGKESACNTGDPVSITGSGRSTGEGIGYPLQYSWASLVAQLVKNLPARWETWVRSLGLERSPAEEKGYPLQYFCLKNSKDCIVHGVKKSWTRLSDFQSASYLLPLVGPHLLIHYLCSVFSSHILRYWKNLLCPLSTSTGYRVPVTRTISHIIGFLDLSPTWPPGHHSLI